jgi:hypothetical protein
MSAAANPIEQLDSRVSFVTSFNFQICEHCGANLQKQLPQRDQQIWSCIDCKTLRAWGTGQPWDSQLRPALYCDGCDAVTRHRFTRVI